MLPIFSHRKLTEDTHLLSKGEARKTKIQALTTAAVTQKRGKEKPEAIIYEESAKISQEICIMKNL